MTLSMQVPQAFREERFVELGQQSGDVACNGALNVILQMKTFFTATNPSIAGTDVVGQAVRTEYPTECQTGGVGPCQAGGYKRACRGRG